MKLILVAILSVLATDISFGQFSIRGKISDSGRYPIEFATIRVYKDSAVINTAITDSTGAYRIINIPADKYRLIFSCLHGGNLAVPVILIKDTTVNVVMEGRAYTRLNSVTVSGKREFERKADRFVYTPDKALIEGSNAIDLMRHVPLLNYDARGEMFSILGKSNTVIYINNKKTALPSAMLLQMLQSMPAENIRSVELITNPGSEYAANTSGGIININIKRQLYEGWLGNLSLVTMQGPYNTSVLNGAINYRKEKLAIQWTPSFSNNYNYYTRHTELTYTDNTLEDMTTRHFRRYQVLGSGLNIDYDIDARNFLSYTGWLSDVYGRSNSSTLTKYSRTDQPAPDSLQNAPLSGTDFYIYNFGNLNYHRNIDSAGASSLDLNIDYNQFFQRRKNDGSFNNVDAEGKYLNGISQYRNDLPQRFFNISGQLQYDRPMAFKTKLSVGAQFSNTTVDNNLHYYNFIQDSWLTDTGRSVDYYYSEKYYAGFISLTKRFNEKWNGNAGLRVEGTHYSTQERNEGLSVDTSYVRLFPAASIAWSPDQRHQLSLSFARKIMRPNIELLFPGRTWYAQNYFSQNNPFLTPALYSTSELSFTLNSRYVFLLTYTHSDNSYSNFILPVVDNNSTKLESTWYNYGFVNSIDFVVTVRQPVIKKIWSIYFTPSFNYSKYHGTSPVVPVNVTNYSLNLQFDNYVYLSRKRHLIGYVFFKYASPIKDISGQRLNARSSLDLEVAKTIKKFSFYIIAGDIYNGYSIRRDKVLPNYLLSQDLSETNSYNRSILFRVRYSFGNDRLKKNKERGSANEEIRRRSN